LAEDLQVLGRWRWKHNNDTQETKRGLALKHGLGISREGSES
jgi:hypothetical protein